MMPNTGSWDRLITQIQETGEATVGITATDDLCISVPVIKTMLEPAGIECRVFVRDNRTLRVVAR